MSTSRVIVIVVNGLLLFNWAAADPWDRLLFVFECVNPSTSPQDMVNQLFDMTGRDCELWKITDISAGLSHVCYRCGKNTKFCGGLCNLEGGCRCCPTTYAGDMCEYDYFSLNRLSNTCTPLYDEMNMRETIESASESEQIYGKLTDRLGAPQTTGRPFCNNGELNMIIHPCCVPPLMLVADKGECMQKVLCAHRREASAAFKRTWDDETVIGDWKGPLHDAWDRLRPWPKLVLYRVMDKLAKCMNATNRVSGVNEDKCGRCNAQEEVLNLYEMGIQIQ
ncbi:uncharacterized protein LOC129594567 [Paramacrobiotus metropolitanus]|uniref:uncharacterized protein LOC129594567 n=1 Tax=Paramacrobiotus metropolitanus TaxID=2943436 RepID=UPI002445D71B|nr:uncharacterized protein LOC129594567 [Paramacrobiotus metropolitanus]